MSKITSKTVAQSDLNKVIYVKTRRKNGSLRIQTSFENCPTLTEQHTAHLTDINWLMEKYKPDELAQYLIARTQHRQEIVGHDFSREPSLQDGMNVVYQARKNFDELPEDLKKQFSNHVEFLKFIDNPANAEKMVKMGLLTRKQVEDLRVDETDKTKPPTPPKRTQDDESKEKAT